MGDTNIAPLVARLIRTFLINNQETNMKTSRRALLAFATAIVLAAPTAASVEARTLNFSVKTYNSLLKSGKPFMLGVHTSWCSTCDRQKRTISALKSKGKPYSSVTILEMDWDKYRGSKIGRQLRIPRRSTLIMYNGKGKEVGRTIAGTSTSTIKGLFDKGV